MGDLRDRMAVFAKKLVIEKHVLALAHCRGSLLHAKIRRRLRKMHLVRTHSYGTRRYQNDLVPVVVMAQGDSIDDLIPAISDDVAATLAMDDIKSVEIEDLDGNKIEPYVCSVCEALFGGATTILVKQTYIADGSTRTDVYTINELD